MIAKHIPLRSIKKSDFVRLAKYITDGQNKTERLGVVRITNCASDFLPAAMAEVMATQQMNTRAKSDKTYHLLISFRPEEKPSNEVLAAIEDRFCQELGFGEHQRISAVHHDTDNLHIHVAINKIHPEKLTIHEPYYPYKTMGTLCEALEKEFSLEIDNHQGNKTISENKAQDMEKHSGIESLMSWIRRECLAQLKEANSWRELHSILDSHSLSIQPQGNGFVVVSDRGVTIKASSVDRALSKAKLESKLGAFVATKEQAIPSKNEKNNKTTSENKTQHGKTPLEPESLIEWIRRECLAQLKEANSWTELQSILNSHGLNVKPRGNGFVFVSDRGVTIKASSVDRALSKAKLESKLGAFAATKEQAIPPKNENTFKKSYDKTPKGFRVDTTDLFAKYQAEQSNIPDLKNKKLESIRKSSHTSIKGLRDSYKLKRLTIKYLGVDRFAKKVLYARAHKAFLKDVKTNNERHKKLRSQVHQQYKRTSWADWLKTQATNGNNKAVEALRSRERVKPETKSRINGKTKHLVNPNDIDSVTKNGTTILKHKDTVIREDDAGLSISKVVTEAAALDILNFAKEWYGDTLEVGGSSAFKVLLVKVAADNQLNITFQDPLLEKQRKLLLSKPAVIVGWDAADKYISEREAKRLKVFDIPKHSRYTSQKELIFSGRRNVDGQLLALLENKNEIFVLPITEENTEAFSSLRRGDPVSISKSGLAIKNKLKGQG